MIEKTVIKIPIGSGKLGIIKMSCDQLKHYKSMGSSTRPELLERDIKIMDWVMAQGEDACLQFLKRRYADEGLVHDRLEVVNLLGWKIPGINEVSSK